MLGEGTKSVASSRSVQKQSVAIDETKWKKLGEKAKSGHYLYKCLNEGCPIKTINGDRWKHLCSFK